MQAFIELRKRARERRDKAIGAARDEYTSTLVRIAALEQDLLGKLSSTHKMVSTCINSVVPTDRPFTTHDIMAGLVALDDSRDWRMRAIVHHLGRLRVRKIIRRIQTSKGNKPAVYVRVGVPVDETPFGDKTLLEVISETLAGKTMTVSDIAVGLLERGYQTTMDPKRFRDAVGVVLRRERKRFKGVAGRWAIR